MGNDRFIGRTVNTKGPPARMLILEQTMIDISITPYSPGISLECSPCCVNGRGVLRVTSILEYRIDQLLIEDANWAAPLIKNTLYSWNAEGGRLSGHWTYCIDAGPKPTFGVVRDGSKSNASTPLCHDLDQLVVTTEALCDLFTDEPTSQPDHRAGRAQLGATGAVAIVSAVVPCCTGILIKDPNLPQNITEGTKGISIYATSARTLQTVALHELQCAYAGSYALFLKEV